MNTLNNDLTLIKNSIPSSKTFTLVGGCFDLIHVGHLHLLEQASLIGDLLVVAVLSDSYIKKYKNSLHPIINQEQRLKMIASIRFVDFAFISDLSPSSIDVLSILKPNTVVFGEETADSAKLKTRLDNIALVSPGTKVNYLPRYENEKISTSLIIDRIRTKI
jgi:cytidyltransferase-like protein